MDQGISWMEYNNPPLDASFMNKWNNCRRMRAATWSWGRIVMELEDKNLLINSISNSVCEMSCKSWEHIQKFSPTRGADWVFMKITRFFFFKCRRCNMSPLLERDIEYSCCKLPINLLFSCCHTSCHFAHICVITPVINNKVIQR